MDLLWGRIKKIIIRLIKSRSSKVLITSNRSRIDVMGYMKEQEQYKKELYEAISKIPDYFLPDLSDRVY